MFYIFKDLFTDEKCFDKLEAIKTCLINKKFKFGVYCIMLPTNDKNLFDIININELKFKYYQNKDNYIVGFASSKEEAAIIIAKLVEEVLIEYGELNIRKYVHRDNFDLL